MNLFSLLFLFYKRKIEPGFKIPGQAFVVDLGSGDKPFWRADIFVDKLSLGDVQRTSNTATVRKLGKFVDSDIASLPFKNKQFDFSFCSHLLEHVEDPKKVLKEIMRVSKSGYLEIPNGVLETIKPFHSHLWFIYLNKNKLTFIRKSKKEHEVLTQNSKDFEFLLVKINEPFIRMYWKRKIDYEIIDKLSKKEKYVSKRSKVKLSENENNGYMMLIKTLRLFFYKRKSYDYK